MKYWIFFLVNILLICVFEINSASPRLILGKQIIRVIVSSAPSSSCHLVIGCSQSLGSGDHHTPTPAELSPNSGPADMANGCVLCHRVWVVCCVAIDNQNMVESTKF